MTSFFLVKHHPIFRVATLPIYFPFAQLTSIKNPLPNCLFNIESNQALYKSIGSIKGTSNVMQCVKAVVT